MSETPSSWQPVETAPRDGTRILLWDEHRGVAISGFWHTDPGIRAPDEYAPPWSFWVADNNLIEWDGIDYPIYWMPLHPPTKRGTR